VNGGGDVDDVHPEIEERYLIAPGEARVFLACAADHLSADRFDPARPIAFVRSTYFDTDDLDLFRSKRRRRIRLREYAGAPGPDGIATLTGVCAFELKEAIGAERRKARFIGDRTDLQRLLRRGPHRPIDPELARAAADVRGGRLHPRLTTFFRRRSYSGDGIRITLDDRLTFSRPVRLGRAGEPAEPPDVIGRGPQLVLEIKLACPRPRWLAEAVRGLLLMTRFSKFKGGMLALGRADEVALAPPRASMASWFQLHELPGAHPLDSGTDR
jgi:hypothetical protein